MQFLKLVATILCLAIAGIGALGVAAPGVLLDFVRIVLAPQALVGAAAVRIVVGVLLIVVAAQSRLPRTLRVIGVVIVVAGLITPLIGAERFLEIFSWFSAQEATLRRAIAVVPVIVGLFFVYAINSRRHGAA